MAGMTFRRLTSAVVTEQFLAALFWLAYLGPYPNSAHWIELIFVATGLLGVASLRWHSLRWFVAPANGILALALLIPSFTAMPDSLRSGAETMSIERWGEVHRAAPSLAVFFLL